MRIKAMVVVATASIMPTVSAHGQDTLYQDLGAKPGIQRIVATALELFLADVRIKDDFDNINLDRLGARLADELCVTAGGPCEYKGRSMSAAHKGLGLNRAKFNAVAEDLQTAMEHHGVSYRVQNRLMARLAPMQRDIVTR